ncbi:MAG: PAS domain-containing protein [Myxococcales bacterium]|nr:PAS domain-containing protein [Myxococcales bacterium]
MSDPSIIAGMLESPVPTALVDGASLKVLAANGSLAELIGANSSDIIGRPLDGLFQEAQDKLVQMERQRHAVLLRKDGKRVPVELCAIFVEHDPQPAIVLRLQPRTPDGPGSQLENRHLALQRSHRELQSAYNRLELLNDTLNLRNRELREAYRQLAYASKMAAIAELTAGATHGINNPLAVAVSGLREVGGVLAEHPAWDPDGRLAATVRRMDLALKRIEGIVSDLRRVARIGVRRSDIRSVDLAHEVRLALDLVSHKLSGIEMVVDVPEGISVRAAPDEFNQVIMNLVDNAVYAMNGQGRLSLRARIEQRQVALEIEDSGPGIPPDIRERVFEPFFSTKTAGKGSGIGLAVSRSIIEGYAGTLTLADSTGGGARFVIRLPIEVTVESSADDPGRG